MGDLAAPLLSIANITITNYIVSVRFSYGLMFPAIDSCGISIISCEEGFCVLR